MCFFREKEDASYLYRFIILLRRSMPILKIKNIKYLVSSKALIARDEFMIATMIILYCFTYFYSMRLTREVENKLYSVYIRRNISYVISNSMCR